MAHQCIKYRLRADGTIPDFLYLGEDGVGGVYAVPDPSTSSPRDMVMVGISNGIAGDYEVIHDKPALWNYLSTVGANWKQPDPTQPDNPDATIPFDADAAAEWVWGRLTALNV